jgi:hypothetical protein
VARVRFRGCWWGSPTSPDHTGKWELSAKTQDASIEAWHAIARADCEERDSILYALDDTGLHFATGRTSLTTLAREGPAGYLGIVRTNASELVTSLTNPVTERRCRGCCYGCRCGAWPWSAPGARRSGTARLLLAVGALPLATALAFFVQPRYVIVAVALATPFVGAAIAALSPCWRRPGDAGDRRPRGAVVGAGVPHNGRRLVAPLRPQRPARGGEWLAANTRSDDRIMTRSMIVDYYADRATMAIPYADLDEIMTYARHYGAQYLVVDWYTAVRFRPQLARLRTIDRTTGLRLVHDVPAEGRTTRIFALGSAPEPRGAPMGSALGVVGDGQSES